MGAPIRITLTVAAVLQTFLDAPRERRYGFELMRATGLASGTLYPILARLERAGWLTSHREEVEADEVGRPPRRFYVMTAEGQTAAHVELAWARNLLSGGSTPSGRLAQGES